MIARWAFCTLLAILIVGVTEPANAQDLEQQIRSEVLRIVERINSADATGLADMYLREPTVGSLGDGQITKGWDNVANLFSLVIAGGQIRMAVDSVTVTPLGDDAAVAYFRYYWDYEAEGAPTTTGAMTVVFVRSGDTWKVAHDHTSTLQSTGIGSLPPLNTGACGVSCGVQRWPVKTLSDPMRDQVNLQPVRTTVAELAAIPRPSSLPQDRRTAPVELTTYVVDAYLVGWSPQDDRDIHLVLVDPEYQRVSMIAEIPDASCSGVCHSGLGEWYSQARRTLQAILDAPNPNDEPYLIRVTGVGFFDHDHGQTGAASNFIELHPVLQIEWLR